MTRKSEALLFTAQRPRVKSSIVSFCLLVTLLVGCTKTPRKSPSSKYRLHLNINQQSLTLDPRKAADLSSVSVQYLLFDGLIHMTPYSTSAPGLAEEVTISDDGLIYTFHLRNLFWSNGDPITAFDVIQTWKDILSPSFMAPNSHLLYVIRNAEKIKLGLMPEREIGVRAVDHRTIEVHLERPTPYFLEMLSFSVFHPVNQSIAIRNNHWSESISKDFVSSGPFRLKEWRQGDHLVLEKNPYYWDANNVQLEEIYISLVSCEQTAMQMYEQGDLDFLGLPFTGIVSDSVPRLMDKGLIRTSSLPASTICCFNMHCYPFTNKNMRKAFAYALNRQEIIENVTLMNEEVGPNLLPRSFGMVSEPFFEDGDAQRAREYLEQALEELDITKENLPPLRLLHASSGIYAEVAKAMAAQWQSILGVQVQLEGYEYKIFLDKLSKRDYQLGQCIWIAQYNDPMNFFDRFRSKSSIKNYSGYYNKEYEDILLSSMAIEDSLERYKYLKKAEEILNDDMPMTAIYHWNNSYLVKDYVQNFHCSPSGGFFFHGVTIEEEFRQNQKKINKKATLRLGNSSL